MTICGEDNGSAMGAGDGTRMFEFEVKGNYKDGALRLVSITPDKHMNFVVMPDKFQNTIVTLSAEAAKEVRDALIRAYPLTSEPHEYRVEDMGDKRLIGAPRYAVRQRRMVEKDVTVATSYDALDAKKIAQALNEAEGL